MSSDEQGKALRPKVPKDGFGPRGTPDCYYTSRVLNSTSHYVRFVRRLRMQEAEEKRAREARRRDARDTQVNEFFARSDRTSFVRDVAGRVDLCLLSYVQDLNDKRNRLKDLLSSEEQFYIHKFVNEIQAGETLKWHELNDRLAYLLDKRQKEKLAKYKDTPLSKCAHIEPCLVKLRAKEAQEVQLYQMREKQQRREAERELEHMWHELAMSEAQALAARLEYDTMERARRDTECNKHQQRQLAERRDQRDRHRELLKQEAIRYKAQINENDKKDAEAQEKLALMRREATAEREQYMRERENELARRDAQAQRVSRARDELTKKGCDDIVRQVERARRVERELDVCNKKLEELKVNLAKYKENNVPLIEEEMWRRQNVLDLKRCQDRKRTHELDKANYKYIEKQIVEKQKLREGQSDDTDEYHHQINKQLELLVKHKAMTDAQARKLYQQDINQQMEYNQLLKERARHEAQQEQKMYQLATEEYQQEISKMLCRPFFSNELHPFMKQMSSGLKMKQICPCEPASYCVAPKSTANT